MIPTPVHKEARDENQDTDSIAGAGVIAGLTGLALANGSVELARWVLGGRVSDSAVGSTTLRATLGQPVVGVVSSGDVMLGQGFWHGGSYPAGGYDIYLPLIQR
jgi:hypothetical protein